MPAPSAVPHRSDDLLVACRRRARAPDDALTDAEILSIADEELAAVILPFIRKHRENYGVKFEDQTLVSGTRDYRIPQRAQGASLRDVAAVNSAGDEFSLPEIPFEDHARFRSGSSTWWPNGMAFSIAGDMVRVLPTPTAGVSSTLRLHFYFRPGRLVPAVEAAAINTITITGAQLVNLTCDNVPAGWSTTNTFDLVSRRSNFDTLRYDLPSTSVTTGSGGIITLGVGTSVGLNVGDFVCLARESCIVQVPQEIRPSLFSAVTVRMLEALGDREGAVMAQKMLASQIDMAAVMLEPRVDGESGRVINWSSPLRFGRRRR